MAETIITRNNWGDCASQRTAGNRSPSVWNTAHAYEEAYDLSCLRSDGKSCAD